MKGRKIGDAYELYGFIPRMESGKHLAICKSCNRVLQNSAASRLLQHSESCAAKISRKHKISTKAKVKRGIPTIVTEKQQENQQEKYQTIIDQHQFQSLAEVKENGHEVENVCRTIKMEEDDASILEFNVQTNCEHTIDNTHEYVKSPCKSTKKQREKCDDKVKAKIKYIKEKTKYFQSELNNLNVEKTMMILEINKLQLEIMQLQTEH